MTTSPRFRAANTLSMDWHVVSIDETLTACAAPLRLCASRKTVSMIAWHFSDVSAFSRSKRPDDIAFKCSAASIRNVSINRFRNASSFCDTDFSSAFSH